MHKRDTRRIAGNCCCLIPVALLLIILVAGIIIGLAASQHGGHHRFGWGSSRDYSGAYRDGFSEGDRAGAAYATRGDAEPSGGELETLAAREADRLNIRQDRGQWIQGFRNGFTRGYRNFSKQTSTAAFAHASQSYS